MNDEQAIEAMARQMHDQWAHWTRYMLKKLFHTTPIPPEAAEDAQRWYRQIDTPYIDLSEEEKESDREWARRAISLMVPYIQAHVLASTNAAHAAMVRMASTLPPLMNVVHDQVTVEVPEGGDLGDAWVQLQMQMDQLSIGTSFRLKGKRVDPKHVLLKEDGTYEIVEDRFVPWVPVETVSKDSFYNSTMGIPFRIDNPCPVCGNQLRLRNPSRGGDYICDANECTFDSRNTRSGRGTSRGRMQWRKPNRSNGPSKSPEKCLGCGHLLIEKPCIMCKMHKPNSAELLARIKTARDRHAEEGEYPVYPYGPADHKNGDPFEQDFDDWAADIVSYLDP